MTTEERFWEDISAHPEDDAIKLIYADWLEEQPLATATASAVKDQAPCSTPASDSFSPASSAGSSEAHFVLEPLGCFAADA